MFKKIKWELYDLNKDPNEMINRMDDPAYSDALRNLKKLMKDKKNEYEKTAL